MEPIDFKELIQKYLDGQCSEKEKAYLEAWYADFNAENELPLPGELSEELLLRTTKKIKQSVFQSINKNQAGAKHNGKGFDFRMLAASIAALIVLVGGIFLYLSHANSNKMMADVPPGGNKAFLILGDGTSLNLDSVSNGQIGLQSGSNIVKLSNGKVIYQGGGLKSPLTSTRKADQKITYNTLKVPLGGQYNLTLPDGTKVWLNAGSSLKFPASFAQLSNRRVYLTGEAYFEVFHDPKHPFYVKTKGQEARVLGTHFDIEAYDDSKAVKTTLLEGSLKVVSESKKDSCLLVPGKQAVLTDQLKVRNVDLDAVIDWKDGYFIFSNESLQDILTKVARWYNVSVVYQSHAEHIKLDGIISKNTPLSEVLSLLSATNKVNFKIQGKVLYVVK